MPGRRRKYFLAAVLLAVAAPLAARETKPNPHAGIECTFCHAETPRFGVDTRETVTFWRAEGDEPALCERCHGPEANFHPLGVIPGLESLGTRKPASLPLGVTEAVREQVVCTTCHFLHATNADFALLRGFPGSSAPGAFPTWEEFCRECHGTGLERRSPHAGDDRACGFCHAARPQAGRPATVTPRGRRLCEFCHGDTGSDHYAGVNLRPQARECTDCHDPHLGKEHPARLVRGYFDPSRDTVTLDPHGKRTLCFACHTDEGPGLRAADAVALCQRCHGSGSIPGMSHPLMKVPAGYAIPAGWPLVDGAMTCLTCHVPGHVQGAVPGRGDETEGSVHLLRGTVTGARNAVCFRCHAKDQWAARTPHQDAARGDKKACTLCHAVDPEEGDPETFVADINIICLACHDSPDHPGSGRHTLTLKPGMPEVRGSLPLGTGRRITCATCHDPHLDAPTGNRLRGEKGEKAFCARCHSF